VQEASWLGRGHTFFQLHLLLDKHAEEQLKLIDLIAERVQALGGVAITDPRHVDEVTTIPWPPNGAEQVPAMLSRLLEAYETEGQTPSPRPPPTGTAVRRHAVG